MKRLIAILLVALLATSFAMANVTPTGTGTVNVDVVVALTIDNPSLNLPPIGAGDQNSSGPWNLVFTVTGSDLIPFSATNIALASATAGSPALTITDPSPNTGLYTSGGTATLTYPISLIDATAATVGSKVITYTVTVSYDY